MASDPETCGTMMRRLLSTCVDAKLVDADTCDDVLSDFSNFMRTTPHGDLESFDVTNDRLDAFLHQRVSTCHKMASGAEVTCAVTRTSNGGAGILHK